MRKTLVILTCLVFCFISTACGNAMVRRDDENTAPDIQPAASAAAVEFGDIYWSFTELETKTNELIDIESSEINEMWWVRFNEIYYDAGAIAEANAAAVENAQLSEVDTVLANNLSEIIALYVDAFELVKAAEAEKDDREIIDLVFDQLKTNVADANSQWDRALLDATS